MARWPHTPAHWVGLLAAAALAPFIVIDAINLKFWTGPWDIWAITVGFTVLYCAIAYGLGWGITRVAIWVFTKARGVF